jgi:CRP-like cAMP-binding protein
MVMKGLVQRLRQANRAIESLALLDVYGRVVRVLKESGREEAPGHWVLDGKVSRQDVAKMIGASREMVSRVLKDLEERGFVQSLPDGRTAVRDQISFT